MTEQHHNQSLTEETVLDPRSLVKALLQAHDDWSSAAGTPLYGEAADALNKAEAAVVAALSRAPEAGREGAAERLAIVAEKPAHLIRWGEGDRLDLQSVLAALSPPSTGGEGEDWDRIPRAKRFGRRLNESAVKHLAPGTLLRFYSEDPWFDPSPSSPANGDIVVFTGEVSNTFPKVGPHLEVRTLGGRVYPGGGWVYQIFQFVADPSPEMGEISREWLARTINPWAFAIGHGYQVKELQKLEAYAKADAILLKLKENGLSREGLGGSARASRGAAGPSDCAEGDARLSDGWQDISSAPKDGQDVLIWNAEGAEIARWYPHEEDGSDQPGHDEGWIGTFAFPGRSWGNRLRSEPQGQPSHWMPLPEPPAEEDLSGAQRSELTRPAQDEPVSSPPSTGGAGEANQVGAAEAEVGRHVYRRIERLMGAKPGTVEGAELCYLAEIAEGVEEYGEQACDGHPLGRFPHPSPEMGEWRPEVRAFADLMEAQLRANDHKPGWKDDTDLDLFERLGEESAELLAALHRNAKRLMWGDDWVMEDTVLRVGREAADVANFALMIADVCGALKLKENGLSREGLGGLARSQPGSDAQERSPVPPLSDGGGA